MSKQYFLDKDGGDSWYLVEADYAEEWEDWLIYWEREPDEGHPVYGWGTPHFVQKLFVQPNQIWFDNPQIVE